MNYPNSHFVLVFRDGEVEDHFNHEARDAALDCKRAGRLLWVDEIRGCERRTVLGVCEPCEKSPHFKGEVVA